MPYLALLSTRIAHLLSIVFHPLFLSLPAVWMVLHGHPVSGSRLYLFTVVFVFSALLPMVAVALLKAFGRVSSVTLHRREERRWPLFVAVGGSLLQALVIYHFDFPLVFVILSLATACITASAMLITNYWKISIHLTGWGGFAVVFIMMAPISGLRAGYAIAMSFFIAMLVGWARVNLKAHNPAQVIAGFALGFIIMGLGLMMFI